MNRSQGRLKIVASRAEYVDGATFVGRRRRFRTSDYVHSAQMVFENPRNRVALSRGAVTDRGGSLVVVLRDDQLAQRMNVSAKHSQSNVTLKADFTDITTTL